MSTIVNIIFQNHSEIIKNNILKFLIKPVCTNCDGKTKDWKEEYCEWCGYNICFNIKY